MHRLGDIVVQKYVFIQLKNKFMSVLDARKQRIMNVQSGKQEVSTYSCFGRSINLHVHYSKIVQWMHD